MAFVSSLASFGFLGAAWADHARAGPEAGAEWPWVLLGLFVVVLPFVVIWALWAYRRRHRIRGSQRQQLSRR
jgi:hypothetical protein